MNELAIRNNTEKELFRSQFKNDLEIKGIKRTMVKSNEEFRCERIIREMDIQKFGVIKK